MPIAATYKAGLDTGEFKSGADDAVRAVQGMQRALKADQDELRATTTAMRALKAATVVDKVAFEQLSTAAEQAKQRIADSTAALTKLAAPLKEIKSHKAPIIAAPETRGFGSAIKAIAGDLKYFGGGVGASASRVENWGKLLEVGGEAASGVAAVVGGVTIGVGLMAAAAGAAAYKIYDLASAHGEARRAEEYQLAGLATLSGEYANAAARGADAQAAIDAVARTSSQGRDKLVGYIAGLLAAGMSGDELRTSLQGVALAADVQGEAGARAFQTQAIAAAKAGKSVDVLYRKLDTQLGRVAQGKLLATAASVDRLKDHFDHLFDGVQVDGLLSARAAFNDLFDAAGDSEAGKIMHDLARDMGQVMVDAAAGFMVASVVAFDKTTVAALKLRVGVNELYLVWLRLRVLARSMDIFKMGKPVVGYGRSGRPELEPGQTYNMGGIPDLKVKRGLSADDAKSDATKLGAEIAKGVVDGMHGDAPAVALGARGLAIAADEAFRDETETHSPSRLFRRHGRSLVDGLRLGLRDGQGALEADLGDMTDVEANISGKQTTAATGDIVNNFAMTFNVTSTEPKKAAQEISDIVLREFRRVAGAA